MSVVVEGAVVQLIGCQSLEARKSIAFQNLKQLAKELISMSSSVIFLAFCELDPIELPPIKTLSLNSDMQLVQTLFEINVMSIG